MSFNYPELVSEITSTLAEYGRSAKLRTVTKSGTLYNPTLTNVDADITVVSGNYKQSLIDGTIIKQSLIDGTIIKQGDLQFFVQANEAIDTGNKIIDGADVYNVMDVQLIKPGAVALLYILQCRK